MDKALAGRIASFLVVFLIPPFAVGAVGRTPGSADVSGSGEATYSIPIFAPPGTHGMTPQLSINYGHNNASTLLGAGWSIGGLSAITRCPKIWAADGEMRHVRNDLSDRFCLDGNKLRLVSGTYGNAGATYQTEIETFARVTSSGAAGNGPASFVVESKDGLIYEYGNTDDSRIESLNQVTARTWALNQIRDRSGNAINFTYFEDTTNGAYRIDLVQYTSNISQALSSAYQVDFVWETKPTDEIDSGYIAGSKVKQITRLDRVDVKYDATLVRRYELTYEAALSSTSKSRLASIQECAGATPDCFPATTFSYQNGTSGLSASDSSLGAYTLTRPWPMDVNGDGREDLVYSSNTTSGSGTWLLRLGSSSGYGSVINTGVTNTNFLGAIPIDYNADGLEDLLIPYSGGTWWVLYGTASGFAATPVNTGAPATGTGADARAFDVNGDGLDDLVWADLVGYAGGDTVRYRLRDWSGGGFSSTVSTLVGAYPPDSRIESSVFGLPGRTGPKLVADLNGDGKGDFVYRETSRVFNPETGQYTFIRNLVPVCPGAPCAPIPNPNAAGVPTHGDFNGDGKSDLLYLAQSGGLVARFSTGTGLTNPVVVSGGLTGWAVVDWDGDGFDDVLTELSGVWQLRRATGEGFAAAVSTGISTAGAGVVTIADGNGDGLYDLIHLVGSDVRYRAHDGFYPDLLLTATDGFGNYSTFTYAPLPMGNYSKMATATYPTQEYAGPLYVVSNVKRSNGIGGFFNLKDFYYQGARVDLQGRDFLGFLFRSWVDDRDGTAQRRTFRQDFPYIGAVTNARRTQEPSGTAISEVQTTFSTYSYGSGFETRSFPFASTITSYDREAGGTYNGNLIRSTVQQILVHSTTGTPYDTTTTVTEPASGANGVQAGASYVQRVYSPTANFSDTPGTWCRGRPGQTQVISSHNQFGGGAITRTTDVTWDTTACRPTQVVEESGNALLQVTRAIGYDAFGNVNSDSVTGIGMTARTTTANWGATGQFPTSVTRVVAISPPFSETINLTWNYAFGTSASATDPNGIAGSWLYDDFGRRTRENRPDGTYTTYEYNTNAVCDPRHKYYVLTTPYTSANTPISYHYLFLDQLGRPIDEYRWSFSTTAWDSVVRTYDSFGRVSTEGAPYSSGGCTSYSSPFVTTFQYDLNSRPTQVSKPTSDSNPALQTTSIYYEGLTTRVVDPLTKQTTRVSNVVGGIGRSIDHDGYYQTFDYDGFGNVVRVVDSLTNTLQSNTFNIRGVRTAQTDMDAGSSTFTSNALGEITLQTDAKSQNTTFGYDLLGRLTSRTEAEGTSTFTFGTSAPNIGRLASMSGPGYSEGFTYDGIGRLKTRSITSDATYAFDYSYNNQGSLDTLTYPVSTPTSPAYRLKLQYEYQSGQLVRVKDFNAPTTVFWQANAKDAWGHVIDETLGNGVQTVRGFDLAIGVLDYIQSGVGGGTGLQNLTYSWDAVGNLTQRQSLAPGPSLTEGFGYDNLHRLTTTTGPDPMTIAFNSMGNITSKTGVGTYTYHATKKHQVTATSTGSLAYGYDANGNMNSRAGSSISWYSYNLPNTISGPSSNSSQFFYGPDRSRWKQVASYAGTSEQTIYIGGLLEKVTLGGATHWKHYIAGGTGVVAEHIRHSTGTNETVYLLKDHLGSTETISGSSTSRLSFDAWGRRRNGGTWSGNPAAAAWTNITNTTRHGFTSHEMLDNLNLTHMNGRVYDQILGRFLSADPIVQAPGFTQSFNRYSYVANNPLGYTDPSGFSRDRPWVRWIDGPRPNSPDGPDNTKLPRYSGGRELGGDNWRSMEVTGVMGQFAGRGGDSPGGSGRVPRSTPPSVDVPVDPNSLSTAGGACLGGCHSGGFFIPEVTPEVRAATTRFYQNLGEDFIPGAGLYQLGTGRYFLSGDEGSRILGGLASAPYLGFALRRAAGAVRVTAKGLARVEAHLDDVLVNQQIPIELQAGERAMLERLRSGLATQQDIEFYLHELKESAIFRRTDDLARAHQEALRFRGVTERALFHRDVVEQFPEFFNSSWRN